MFLIDDVWIGYGIQEIYITIWIITDVTNNRDAIQGIYSGRLAPKNIT